MKTFLAHARGVLGQMQNRQKHYIILHEISK